MSNSFYLFYIKHSIIYISIPQSKLIRNTKYLLRILLLYIPVPFFWALFDQKGSRWTIQVIGLDMYIVSIYCDDCLHL